jgi:hypothetical protein
VNPGRTRLAGAIAATIVACAPVATVAAQAPEPPPEQQPEVEVTDDPFPDDILHEGTTFKIEGQHWPPNTLVQLEVCGSQARSGSADCATSNAQIVAADATGWFRARLAVVLPPSPCPCIIRAMSQTSALLATVPIEIPNAPTAHPGDGTVNAPALRRIEVSMSRLRGSDTWQTWLGGRPKRSLEFEVVNTGSVAVSDATVALSIGPSDSPTGFVKPVKIETLAVGESRTYTVAIEFDSLAYGEQIVQGTVNGASVPETFSASTSTHPWLLIVLPIALVAQAILLFVRNRLRRRLHDDQDALAIEAAPELKAIGMGAAASTQESEGDAPQSEGEPDDDGSVAPEGEPDEAAVSPVDERLIFIVTIVEDLGPEDLVESANPRQSTMVVRDRGQLETMIVDRIEVPAAESVDGVPYFGSIDLITVVSNPEVTVGAAHAACDELSRWIDSSVRSKSPGGSDGAVLRRWNHGSSDPPPHHRPGDGIVGAPEMVVLAVFLRVSNDLTPTTS